MSSARKTSMVLLGVLLFGLLGCSDKDAENSAAPSAPSSSAARRASSRAGDAKAAAEGEAFPGATSNELAHLRACLDALDAGRESLAMRHARELMDSTNVEIRLQAVSAFGWIGRFAVGELAEMMADDEEEVSSEAQRQWEMAFDEIPSEASKMHAIEKAAAALKKQHSLEAVMMKLASLEEHNAVKVLCNVITSTNAAPVAAEVAREEYVSLAGEPFVDARRAEQVAKILKDRAEGILPEEPNEKTLETKKGEQRK